VTLLVLADVHANAVALEAVLADAEGRWGRSVFLGDAVGYGPRPNEACARLRGLPSLGSVRGNHDRVIAGCPGAERFNASARASLAWTAGVLDAEHRDWLAALPRGPVELDGGIVLAHGSPRDEDAYLFSGVAAAQVAADWPGRLLLHGHTHVAAAFRTAGEGERVRAEGRLELGGAGWLLNPGAVGQPRDGRPEAAYALLDPESRWVEFRRVPYDVGGVREEMRRAGLPRALGDRLLTGS
jgi:diadenosine tetraphosphatase ApaH/serine/threonine PP2A family protein phosphatase